MPGLIVFLESVEEGGGEDLALLAAVVVAHAFY